MKVLIAPGAYKGTIQPQSLARIMKIAVADVLPDAHLDMLPLADGGEGTLDFFQGQQTLEMFISRIPDPSGKIVEARWAMVGRTAIIESAQAIGLSLIPKVHRNPLFASSDGVGYLIAAALDHGANEILVGLGDSATMDIGTGMLYALGSQFFDKFGNPIKPCLENLRDIFYIDMERLDPRLSDVRLRGLADTANPLCGHEGQVAMYGAQKGLSPDQVDNANSAVHAFSRLIDEQFDTGNPVGTLPCTSAAGGIGTAFKGILNADVTLTMEYIDERFGISKCIQQSDVVVTGEGRFDEQSVFGKVPFWVSTVSYGKVLIVTPQYTPSSAETLKRRNENVYFVSAKNADSICGSEDVYEMTQRGLKSVLGFKR